MCFNCIFLCVYFLLKRFYSSAICYSIMFARISFLVSFLGFLFITDITLYGIAQSLNRFLALFIVFFCLLRHAAFTACFAKLALELACARQTS